MLWIFYSKQFNPNPSLFLFLIKTTFVWVLRNARKPISSDTPSCYLSTYKTSLVLNIVGGNTIFENGLISFFVVKSEKTRVPFGVRAPHFCSSTLPRPHYGVGPRDRNRTYRNLEQTDIVVGFGYGRVSFSNWTQAESVFIASRRRTQPTCRLLARTYVSNEGARRHRGGQGVYIAITCYSISYCNDFLHSVYNLIRTW